MAAGDSKIFLIMESGVRLHTTKYERDKEKARRCDFGSFPTLFSHMNLSFRCPTHSPSNCANTFARSVSKTSSSWVRQSHAGYLPPTFSCTCAISGMDRIVDFKFGLGNTVSVIARVLSGLLAHCKTLVVTGFPHHSGALCVGKRDLDGS